MYSLSHQNQTAMETNVRKWAQDAVEKLQLGRETGHRANELLSSTKERIKRTNNSLIKANFLLDSLNQQLQLIETVHASLEMNIEEKMAGSEMLLSYLNDSIEQLREEFDRLKAIKVDKSLSSSEPSLYDFISSELLENLELEYDQTEKLLHDALDELERKQKTIKGKLKEFNVEFTDLELVINTINDSGWIDESIEETVKLEEEIAGLIESLANHYDQCSKGVAIMEGKLEVDDAEKEELFKVLENDYEEVPDVVCDMEEVFGDIQLRCSKIDDFIAAHSFSLRLRNLFLKLSAFGEKDLTSAMSLLSRHTSTLEKHTHQMNGACDEALQMIKHYEKFVQSYYSLVLELERRKEVQNTIKGILNDAKSKVLSLQEDDMRFRGSFKQNNGAYLPGDLWEDFNEDKPLVEMSFEFDELPQLQGLTISTAKSHFK